MSPRVAPALLLVLAAQAGAAEPPCRARATLDRTRAVVGQQVIYRIRIEREPGVRALGWERAPSFPSFRAEWLPPGASGAAPAGREHAMRETEERRALFPALPGRLRIAGASFFCRSDRAETRVVVPPVELEVVDPPRATRPARFTGVVGRVELSARLGRTSLRRGESVRLSLTLSGAANLWDARISLASELEPLGLEVFAEPEDMARDAGRRLVLRRYLRFSLVPHRAGPLTIPPFGLSYYDPETRRYAEARSLPLQLRVTTPRAPAAPRAERRPPRAGPARTGGPSPAIALAVALAAAGFGLAAWRRWRRRRSDRSAPPREALAEADRALSRGESASAAAHLARAVRLALEPELAGARALTADQLFALARGDGARRLVLLLQRLDRARFAPGDPTVEVRAARDEVAAVALERPGSEP